MKRRRTIWRAAEIGRDVRRPVADLSGKVYVAATQVFAIVEFACAGRLEKAAVFLVEVATGIEVDQSADGQGHAAIGTGDGRPPVGELHPASSIGVCPGWLPGAGLRRGGAV